VADPLSFDAFYRDTRTRLAQYIYVVTHDLAETQDVTQEAYARAWQRWNTVAGYGDPEAWVRTVAWRLAINRWRRGRSRLVAYRRHGPPPPAPPPDVDRVAIFEALRSLSYGHRAAIVLHYLAGMSVAEVARELGVAEGTVKARLARGRQALAPLLTTQTGAGHE
jgi:RNA polymerase sigma-70 factor, ECF subfamily